jgi:Transposase IS66 family
MDPTRSGAVSARHAGIDGETGQLTGDEDGAPRRLVISSDLDKVYESAGKKAHGLVNLYCWAYIRRHFMRAEDASPVQPRHWTDDWLQRIRDLYAAHDRLMPAWQGHRRARRGGRRGGHGPAGEGARGVGRGGHGDRPGAGRSRCKPRACMNPRRRHSPPWTGNGTAYRAPRLPVVSLDKYADGAVMLMLLVRSGSAAGQGDALVA